MTQSKSKYQFWQEASLSQKLAEKIPEYQEYAGSNPEISKAIANIKVLIKFKILNGSDPGVQLMLAFMNEQRKAEFATSPNTNEISKMGMQMPKGEDIISKF